MTTTKPVFDWALLYVADPLKSADLYETILGIAPVDREPTFSMFLLPNGRMLGLWLKEDVEPKANSAGGAELGFTEQSREAVDARIAAFKAAGLTILQPPTDMDFGYTFTAADPDGHRLRVSFSAAASH